MFNTAQRKEETPEITSAIETITPAQAQVLLGNNANNRKVMKSAVGYYTKMIKEGNWKVNGEAIKIAVDGSLVDGQHRLLAVVEAGFPIETMVVRNLPKESIRTLDTGRARTPADNFVIHGYNTMEAQTLAAATKMIMRFKDDGLYVDDSKSDRVAPLDLLAFIGKHNGIVHSMHRIPQLTRSLMPLSISVGLHYVFSQIDSSKTEEFWSQFANGINLDSRSPVLALRNKLILMKDAKKIYNRRQVVSYTINCFEAFRNGKEMQKVNYDPKKDVVLPWMKA